MHEALSAVLDQKGRAVHGTSPTATVEEAVRAMNQNRVGAVVVLDGERPVGIFTERDVLRRVVGEGRDPKTTRVADVMTREVVAVHPTVTVAEAMAIVTERRCRHLPVVDGHALVGLVSIGDLTRWMTTGQSVQIQQLIEFITNQYPA